MAAERICKPYNNGYIHLVVIVLMLFGGMFVFHSDNTKVDNDGTLVNERDLTQGIGSFFKTTTDWNAMLSFLPYGLPSCGEINKAVHSKIGFNLTKFYKNLSVQHTACLNSFLKNNNIQDVEGHSGSYIPQTAMYLKLASLPFVKTICETGFNAGHSTLVWLTAQNNTNVYSFDLGEHEYGRPMADFLSSKFPGR